MSGTSPSGFQGYLLMGNITHTAFPLQYIEYESWESSPNMREAIKAYRDENTRDLTQILAEGKKSKFKFKTRKGLHLKDAILIEGWLAANETDHDKREIDITFWDDEQHTYKSGTFYRSNPVYKIRRVTDDDIIYNQVEYVFVEC